MKNILKIISLSKPLYPFFLLSTVFIIGSSVLELVAPVVSKLIIDEITLKVEGTGGDDQRIAFLIGVVFAVSVINILATALSGRIGDYIAGRLRKFLTEKFYSKVFTLPQSYFDSEISGKIVNQLNRGIVTIQGFSNTATNFMIPNILVSIFTIALLSYYNLFIGLIVFALFPIYMTLSYVSTKIWGKHEEAKNKLEDIGRGRIQEVISNIKLVKSFNNEKNEYSFISNKQSDINKIYSKQSNGFYIFDFLRNLSLHLVILGVNIVVFTSAFNGTLSIGEMVLILQLIMQARRPLFAMSFILTQVQMAESGSKEYFQIIDLKSEEDYESDKKIERIPNPVIEFKNVSFSYEKNSEVIHDVSFKLDNFEKIALVGHSGAGKSTIINLILKFYNSTKGEILLNNESYNSLPHKFIRENISLVFQENELFSSTIKENVAYGKEASDEEVINALKLANAYDFVSKFSDGIDTQVGERGLKLSGGQKQRIQIARAILKNSPILILDEATSSLDSKSEFLIQEALENLMKNKLVIIIAHRFSTIQNVNKIFVFNQGEIVDSGDPKELANREGIYSELLRYQIEGNKKLLKNYDIY